MSDDKPSQAEGEDEDENGAKKHEVLDAPGKPSQAEGEDTPEQDQG
jgi:hypothetical protein